VDDEEVLDSGQAAQTTLHAALFEHRGGQWAMTLQQIGLAEAGFNGRDPAVALRRIGTDRHAFEVVEGVWNAGSSAESLSLYAPGARELAEILRVSTGGDDCGQHEKCFACESTISYDETSGPSAFDITRAFKGTHRNRAGRIVGVPVVKTSDPLVAFAARRSRRSELHSSATTPYLDETL
jgi:hypothetical protein